MLKFEIRKEARAFLSTIDRSCDMCTSTEKQYMYCGRILYGHLAHKSKSKLMALTKIDFTPENEAQYQERRKL